MPLDPLLQNKIEEELKKSSGKTLRIRETHPIMGGDSHLAWKLTTDTRNYFLKTSKNNPAALFKTEFNGLQLLTHAKAISIAQPIAFGKINDNDYLLLEFIEKSPVSNHFWKDFAQGIANLHRTSNNFFGLKEDNFIGPLPQQNTASDTWSDFFISQRIQPLIKKCIDQNILKKDYIAKTQQLYKEIPNIFPKEAPSLLHGDLWGGNFLCGPSGNPYLFDPAVYYGHREIDLAMTRLFGGFDRKFYWHYNDFFPLSPDWQKRIPICQLYPLLVHSVLFGGGYIQQARRIMEEYG